LVFSVVTPRGLVDRYQLLGRLNFFILRTRWRWKQYIPPKCLYLPTTPHRVTAQNTNIEIM
jgi:hypothetical protein